MRTHRDTHAPYWNLNSRLETIYFQYDECSASFLMTAEKKVKSSHFIVSATQINLSPSTSTMGLYIALTNTEGCRACMSVLNGNSSLRGSSSLSSVGARCLRWQF